MSSTAAEAPSARQRFARFLARHPRVKLGFLLGPPMGWMLVVYLGALMLLFITAFWRQDPLTADIQRSWSLDNFDTLLKLDVYRTVAIRTVGLAAAVTITDIILALPIAYYAARLATPRMRTIMLLLVVLPLWSSYLVRVYAWRIILGGDGLLNWSLAKLHLGSIDVSFSNWAVWITFCYLWLPFVILPIYAALERIPSSMLEASSDLGAGWWRTFRKVILPLAFPGIVAGSIFAFSLTLGDYIAPNLVGNTQFIGTVIYQSVGVANNVPFAAAYALVPVAIMAIYLLAARKMKAFEAL
jgi:putative spermidine/putrescine transport system permease protein